MLRRLSPAVRGSSLVEVMVALVIGMVVVLTIFAIVTTFEGQKRTTTDGSAAQENGLFAMTALERDIRMAGWGLTAGALLDCPGGMQSFLASGPAAPVQVLPVLIKDGKGQPDTITLLSGTSMTGNTPVDVTQTLAGAKLALSSTVGFNPNDLILVSRADGVCNLGQVTAIDSALSVIDRTANAYNPAGGFPGDMVGAKVYNLGQMVRRTYQVVQNANLSKSALEANDLGDAANINAADNIVSLKAQYGLATTTGSGKFANWVNPGALTPNENSALRIQAVRLILVARSLQAEKPDAAGNCQATTAALRPGTQAKPWSPQLADDIDLQADPRWKCFRYKSFELVAPLRNVMWAK